MHRKFTLMSDTLVQEIRACRLCADRFTATETAHEPRPIAWFQPTARILIAGQAPGARVHASGKPFDDPSGDRLRDWMGVSPEQFYDRSQIAIVPMAFCFPGYDTKGSDLPPPKLCAQTWHARVIKALPDIRLTLLVGGYAHKWHMHTKTPVTDTVKAWRDHAPDLFLLPHPSWRNTGWLKKNPWFAADLLPALRHRVQEVLDD